MFHQEVYKLASQRVVNGTHVIFCFGHELFSLDPGLGCEEFLFHDLHPWWLWSCPEHERTRWLLLPIFGKYLCGTANILEIGGAARHEYWNQRSWRDALLWGGCRLGRGARWGEGWGDCDCGVDWSSGERSGTDCWPDFYHMYARGARRCKSRETQQNCRFGDSRPS
jgi:hypothetical protein